MHLGKADNLLSRAEQSRAEQSRAEQSSRFAGFDILKFLCAFMIVCIHNPFPGAVGEYFTSLTRIAVPIFFMITGYYYCDTVARVRTVAYVKKILVLVIEANLLYLVWKCFYAVVAGDELLEYLTDAFTLKNAVKFLVLNESPFNGHLWYLGAILYVLIFMQLVQRFHLKSLLYYMVPLLLMGDLLFGKYSILLWRWEFPYILVRNWLFVGVPYFSIGMLVRKKAGRKHSSEQRLFFFTVLFSMTTLAERFFLVSVDANATRDHYISTTFLAITVFLLFLNLYRVRKIGKMEGMMAVVGRKYSAWVYVIHPFFITVLTVLMKRGGVYDTYKYVAPVIIYIVSILFVSFICKVKETVVLQRAKI